MSTARRSRSRVAADDFLLRIDGLPTRERILVVASELFAEYGYAGTSTREIGRIVRIQQPSLFHHFESKAGILAELLAYDLDSALRRARSLASRSGPAAPRLYEYLVWDLIEISRSPYNLGGIYNVDILHQPEFETWAKKLDDLFAAQRELVAQGVQSGEFVEIDPDLGQRMIAGLTMGLIRESSKLDREDPRRSAEAAASFVLRGLLADGFTLEKVRRAAES